MIEELLPAGVVCGAVRGDDPTATLLPEEADIIGRAAPKRVREYTLARACARRALSRLGLPPVPILSGPRREPLWPDGVVGSITHCAGYCAAVVADAARVRTVGIDAEADGPLPPRVIDKVAVDAERDWIAGAPSGTHWDKLLFSAKESVYKAWFPLTGRWLGFGDALVTFDPDGATFQARLLVDPPVVEGRELTGFHGRFLARDGLVLTAIVEPRG